MVNLLPPNMQFIDNDTMTFDSNCKYSFSTRNEENHFPNDEYRQHSLNADSNMNLYNNYTNEWQSPKEEERESKDFPFYSRKVRQGNIPEDSYRYGQSIDEKQNFTNDVHPFNDFPMEYIESNTFSKNKPSMTSTFPSEPRQVNGYNPKNVETSKPTSFKLIPSSFLRENTDETLNIVSYKSIVFGKKSLIVSLDEACNLRLIDMNTQQMKKYAIGVINPYIGGLDDLNASVGTRAMLEDALGDKFQKVMMRPFSDWVLYEDGKMLLVQKFDNKIHFLNLDGVLDIDDGDSLEEVMEEYASRNLIQIASQESSISAISIQLRNEEIDESSIQNRKIRTYTLVSGSENGDLKVWSLREGDPPILECLFLTNAFKIKITAVSSFTYPFLNAERLLAYAAGSNQELKAFDILKKAWFTEKPIESSPITVMKILKLRNGEHILATANTIGTVLLYRARNLSLYKSIYVNLNGNHYQVKDLCIFEDPYSKKDVLVIPCNRMQDGNHLLRFYIEGALAQEYVVPQPILFCNIFYSLDPNEVHLVVGNEKGLIDAWNIKNIFSNPEGDKIGHDNQDIVMSSLDDQSELEEEFEKTFEDDNDEISTQVEPEYCPSPKFAPRIDSIPQPIRDSRTASDNLVGDNLEDVNKLEESQTYLPRTTVPKMQKLHDSSQEIFKKEKTVSFDLPPQTPRERDTIPVPVSFDNDSSFLMPAQTSLERIQKQFQHPSYPKQPSQKPRSKVKKELQQNSSSKSKRIEWRNPNEFLNILEQQASELESSEVIPTHPLAQPRAHSTRILEQKILELQNEEFDPEKYMKEKNLLVDRDATIHAYQFNKDNVLYENLPSLNSPIDVSRTRKRRVTKQVSQSYLEEQRALAPQFDEIIFYDELQEEVKCDVEVELFKSRWIDIWKENASQCKENSYQEEIEEDNPLSAPLCHHIGHRFVKQCVNWFNE